MAHTYSSGGGGGKPKPKPSGFKPKTPKMPDKDVVKEKVMKKTTVKKKKK